MAAPPGPLSTTSAAALSKLKLTKTPAGIPIFMIKFTSALGPLLAQTLRSAQAGTLNKTDTRAVKLLEIMYDCLISCMPDDNDVVKMTKDCGLDAHLCLDWLQRKYAPTTTASAVKALLSIFQENLVEGNIVAGIEEKIAANDALPDKVKLEDSVLAILILAKLPPDLTNLVDIIIERDVMPSSDEIRDKVYNQISMHNTKSKQIHTAFAFVQKKGFCFNCDTQGHNRKECTQPKADCSACGKGAGHPDKHCLVINANKEIPASIGDARRALILDARAARKRAGTALILDSPGLSFPSSCSEIPEEADNFWEHLAKLNELGLSP